MNAQVTVSTPLGVLTVSVEASAGPLHEPVREPLASGAEILRWPQTNGLAVDALVTAAAPSFGEPAAMPETTLWGVVWRLTASTRTGPIRVAALLADAEVPSDLSAAEDLITAEFSTADWMLAIGGPDEASISSRAAADGQTTSWLSLESPAQDPAHGAGVAWELPAIGPMETAELHVAVAWCATGHVNSDHAPWFAVETSARGLCAAAGVDEVPGRAAPNSWSATDGSP